jgi:hypothetical protein
VSRQLLEDLTKYYCEFIPAMRRRIVTPYSSAPSHELLKAVNDAHPISSWDEDDSNITDEGMSICWGKRVSLFVFRVVMPYGPVGRYQCFGRTYCFHLLNVEEVCSS